LRRAARDRLECDCANQKEETGGKPPGKFEIHGISVAGEVER